MKFEDLMERHVEAEREAVETVEKADQEFASEVFKRQREVIRRIKEDEVPHVCKLSNKPSSTCIVFSPLTGEPISSQESQNNGLSRQAPNLQTEIGRTS